jgi:hypothetical protein
LSPGLPKSRRDAEVDLTGTVLHGIRGILLAAGVRDIHIT